MENNTEHEINKYYLVGKDGSKLELQPCEIDFFESHPRMMAGSESKHTIKKDCSSKFKKLRHNPVELIKRYWPEADMSHIEYNPDMKGCDRDYWRIESTGHDGTLAFTEQMLQKALIPLMNKSTYYNQTPKEILDEVKDIRYIIGDMRHAVVFGEAELKCGGLYPGLKESVKIPVKCEYIL